MWETLKIAWRVKDIRKKLLYTFGMLIHNNQVIGRLDRAGVRIIAENDVKEIFERSCESEQSTVVIRAHGIPRDTYEMLISYESANKYFKVVDRTCRSVKKIHEIVDRETSDGSHLLVIGDAPRGSKNSNCANCPTTSWLWSLKPL